MNNNAPKVSIGVPVFNGQRYLQECLNCLVKQTFEDLEIVISDNASTDSTEAICREFALRDDRIRYYRQEVNRGANWNFNHVFHLSRGQYFKWAAVDDLCDSRYIEATVETLDDHTDCVWCHSLTVHIDEAGQTVSEEFSRDTSNPKSAHSLLATGSRLDSNDSKSLSCSRRFAAVLLGTTWCADSFGLIRSDCLSETALEGPYYGAEKVLMSELSLRGQFIEIPEVLFFQRIHPGASGAIQSANARDEFTFGTSLGRPRSSSFAILRGYLQAIRTSRISVQERFRCYGYLVRYVFQIRKLCAKLSRKITSPSTLHKWLHTVAKK